MTMEVLKDRYGPQKDWERRAAPIRGASAFSHSLKQAFLQT